MLALYVFIASIAAAIIFLIGCRPIWESRVLMRKNYAGREIPTAVGFLFFPVYILVYTGRTFFIKGWRGLLIGPAESLLLLVTGMCLLGLLDDLLGDRGARGFKGHVGLALKGRITTGFLKALGGLLVAAAACRWFSGGFPQLALNAVLIALCTNLFNLLDTGPGRALKVFFPVLLGVVALNWRHSAEFAAFALCVGATAFVLFPGDLTEKFMLGDAGSNVLGATVGMGVALGAGTWWKVGVLVLLLVLNLVSEKVSFSKVIEANRVLRWMDSLGRKG